MTIKEKKRINLWNYNGKTVGRIKLNYLANPKTVKVYFDGKQIFPQSFDIYGHPIFGEKLALLCEWKTDKINRKNERYIPVKAEIEYKTRQFNVCEIEFNSVIGIEESLKNIKSFNQMLSNRKLYCFDNTKKLNAFVIFGKYFLDVYGQIGLIKEDCRPEDYFDIIAYEYCIESAKSMIASYERIIPETGDVCPCCGKSFTIQDIKDSTFGVFEDEFRHKECNKMFIMEQEIDMFTRCIMDLVYKDKPNYDVIENPYIKKRGIEDIPWFLFHTTDGDIKIGRISKNEISIQWDKRKFDLTIFKDIVGIVSNNCFTIIVDNKNEAVKYLIRVKQNSEKI